MAEQKRYFWLKLYNDFFSSKRIKKLRKMENGDRYLVIYLKMQLLAIKTEGILTFTGLEDTFAEELALDLDEDDEEVKTTLDFLLAQGLVETEDGIHYFYPYADVGSETASAQRVREHRARQKNGVTQVKQECNADVTQVKRECCVEIEKESEIESELEEEEEGRVTPPSPPKLKVMQGTLGQGFVRMTDEQFDDLLDKLTDEELEHYMGVIVDCEKKGKHFTKSHYQAILNMVAVDRGVAQ